MIRDEFYEGLYGPEYYDEPDDCGCGLGVFCDYEGCCTERALKEQEPKE